jgi:hypothetical protein
MIGMAMPLLREMVGVGMFRACSSRCALRAPGLVIGPAAWFAAAPVANCSTRARRHDEEVISGLDLAPAGTSGRREDS